MKELYESESVYLSWIYDLVGGENGPCSEYYYLMSVLLDVDFIWVVQNDENRAKDGLVLRNAFCSEYDKPLLLNVLKKPCSVLEMMIALARRIEDDIMYEYDNIDTTGIWLRQMIENLGLSKCTDSKWNADIHENVIYLIMNLIERRYEYNGLGGLFPLKNPQEDQRDVEIWRQMASFMYENSYQKTYQN